MGKYQQRKVFCLYTLELVCDFTFEEQVLQQNLQSLTNMFLEALQDQETEIQVAGVSALVSLLRNIRTPETLQKFVQIVDQMINLLVVVLQSHNEKKSLKIIRRLEDLIKNQHFLVEKQQKNLLFVVQ